jgi:hypothetical protein
MQKLLKRARIGTSFNKQKSSFSNTIYCVREDRNQQKKQSGSLLTVTHRRRKDKPILHRRQTE